MRLAVLTGSMDCDLQSRGRQNEMACLLVFSRQNQNEIYCMFAGCGMKKGEKKKPLEEERPTK
jgi:hypothetical protein